MKTEQNEKDNAAEANKIIKKVFTVDGGDIIKEIEDLSSINEKVQKSIRHISDGGCVLLGVIAGVVIKIMTEGFEELTPAFLGSTAYFIAGVLTYMLFFSGQLIVRLSQKKALTQGLDLRLSVKVKEVRDEEEKGNGKEKK